MNLAIICDHQYTQMNLEGSVVTCYSDRKPNTDRQRTYIHHDKQNN